LHFSLVGGQLKFLLDNGGSTFFNKDFNSVVGATSPNDGCYSYDTSGLKTVTLSPSESLVVGNNIPNQTRGTMLNISDGGFMGYYIGQSSYEILSITNNRMVVRAVMGGNPALAWYHTFTTIQPVQDPITDYTNLVWSDEFNTAGVGAINAANWFQQTQLAAGISWYNGEVQHYTNRQDNSYVSNGTLKIVAKKETFTDQGQTKQYTSARLNSKFSFTYGRVEVRAKLPIGAGTWPAIWMLGKNVIEPGSYWTSTSGTVNWPACGEVDIMEHWGNNQNYVQSAMHTPSSYGGTVNLGGQTVSTVSTDFHIYALEWTSEKMVFSVDGITHYTYNPAVKDASTWPFNAPQYLLLNVAMQPYIDPNFTQSAMEVDYVRVYQ